MTSIKSFKNFVKNPDFDRCHNLTFIKKLLISGKFILVAMVLMIILQLLDDVMQYFKVYPAPALILDSFYETAKTESSKGGSLRNMLIISLLSAPILEELQYRLFLKKYNECLIAVSVSLILGYQTNRLVSSELWYINNGIIQSLLPTLYIVFFGLLFFLPIKVLIKRISSEIWNSNPKLIFYASATIFSFNHITNYQLEPIHYFFLPIILLPYFIYAIVFGFLRIRLGIMYSMIVHSVFLVPTFIRLFNKFF